MDPTHKEGAPFGTQQPPITIPKNSQFRHAGWITLAHRKNITAEMLRQSLQESGFRVRIGGDETPMQFDDQLRILQAPEQIVSEQAEFPAFDINDDEGA